VKSNHAFAYTPSENEMEKASNGYLMSLVAALAGMPLPIINLIATVIFFTANRKSTYFVRWHCMQALLSQLSLFFINSYGFWWTISIVFGDVKFSSPYFAYIIMVFIFNLADLISTIYTAIQTRKGNHISWWLYGELTNLICRP
jgi:uncharacterized membrane protein